ncbi:hypothetical protein EYZ11_004558 [Aspergillus tanneri]|uniref:Uncharacterized protein n=1 Tax=Aspergillus tanneri TaxID=1220188 RepID=A0A4S3JR37_9EURO|nr:uncharacterized protein ATNIH1004_000376 [Aspergillus tanneri]KAA8651488.1 hypothetical protein ATNIH1004_000376 [Aspergillus tanneri]THC95961.1 hypothetical protein EYZ11_004558 [Aspergillus tanneri]
MTTAPSMAFSTMELPALDDTMEMASPYQGHADDFDIDLDVMEDQTSNADRDMMGADDLPEATDRAGYDEDGPNDADMADDVVEPTMADADEQDPETSYSIEMHYGPEKTYEAEMLEDDYEEDIDAPVSDSQEEAPPSFEHVNNQVEQIGPVAEKDKVIAEDNNRLTEEPPVEIPVEPSVELGHTQHEDLGPQHAHQDDENFDQGSKTIQSETAKISEGSHHDTNQTEQTDFQEADPTTLEYDNTAPEQYENDNVDEVQPSVGEHQEPEDEKVEYKEVYEASEEVEHEHDTHDHVSALYTVKVYYQENEISLFPPREGDSSETFFLEDENLAYEPFGKLFGSCREVLREHVEDNEILIIDIEALNLQLTEASFSPLQSLIEMLTVSQDSSHISKVTLYQMIELYLRLCHNDGIDEPEALYLTLSTKPTIAAEVSDLLAAANQGKGLSEIHSWDDYQEVEAASPDNFQESNHDEGQERLQHNVPEVEDTHQSEAQEVSHENPSVHSPDAVESHKGEQELDSGAEPTPGKSEIAEENVVAEVTGSETLEAHNEEPHDDRAYGSEQSTESTGTISPMPTADVIGAQQYDDGITNIPHENPTDHVAHGDHQENEDIGDEGSLEVDPAVSAKPEDLQEAQHDAINEVHDNNAPDPVVCEFHKELSDEDYESTHPEDNPGITQDHDDYTKETLPEDDGGPAPEDSEPALDSITSGIPAQPPTELADDSLDIAEGLPKSPAEGAILNKNVEATINPFAQADEEAEHATSVELPKDETEELTFDDEEEFLDLGIADEFDFADEEPAMQSPAPAPTKRQREPEDEVELVESPTPDAKRSRSS